MGGLGFSLNHTLTYHLVVRGETPDLFHLIQVMYFKTCSTKQLYEVSAHSLPRAIASFSPKTKMFSASRNRNWFQYSAAIYRNPLHSLDIKSSTISFTPVVFQKRSPFSYTLFYQ